MHEPPPPLTEEQLADGIYLTEKTLAIGNPAAFRRPTTLVRTAHQPNWFPSLNVVSQALVAADLATLQGESSSLFVLIDHDDQCDRRYRHGYFPLLNARSGYVVITAPEQVTWSVLCKVQNSLRSVMRQNVRLAPIQVRSQIGRRMSTVFQDLRTDMAEALEISDSLVQFNSIMIYRRIRRKLANNTPRFVYASQLHSQYGAHVMWLLSVHQSVIAAAREVSSVLNANSLYFRLRDAPFWLHCICGSRQPLVVFRNGMSGDCRVCKRTWKFRGENQIERGVIEKRISPTVVLDNLLDALALGARHGALYAGSQIHIRMASMISERLEIPFVADHLSRVTGDFGTPLEQFAGPAREFIRQGKAADLFYEVFATTSLYRSINENPSD